MNESIPLILSGLAIIIGLVSLYKASTVPRLIEEEADQILSTLDETLKTTLEPIQEVVSKSYSHMGTKGAMVKKEQALDRRLAQDILSMQDPLLTAGLDMLPGVKEYVDKNPEMIVKLLPRVQALMDTPGFQLADLIKPSSSSPLAPLTSSSNNETMRRMRLEE